MSEIPTTLQNFIQIDTGVSFIPLFRELNNWNKKLWNVAEIFGVKRLESLG